MSKLTALVELVSLETLTNDPYFEFILLSIPFNKVESPEPIGIYIGEAYDK